MICSSVALVGCVRSIQPGCVDSSECAAGSVCNAEGSCELLICPDVVCGPCAPGTVADPNSCCGCLPKECTSSSECIEPLGTGVTLVCSTEMGVCNSSCQGDGCPAVCTGTCVPGCTQSSQCETGSFCQNGSCEPLVCTEPECDECGPGFVQDPNACCSCIPKVCMGSTECGDGLVCSTEMGVCDSFGTGDAPACFGTCVPDPDPGTSCTDSLDCDVGFTCDDGACVDLGCEAVDCDLAECPAGSESDPHTCCGCRPIECTGSEGCEGSLICTTERGECNPLRSCRPGMGCPAVCAGTCITDCIDAHCESGEACGSNGMCQPLNCPDVPCEPCQAGTEPDPNACCSCRPIECYGQDCGSDLICSTERGVCDSPRSCRPGQPCPDVCAGTCIAP